MFLKRLEIQGFKSFANKTVLEFLPFQNNRFSVTAVVGPNGSGKSNVVDAIRWVMGEQSLKTLRGKKSEDIIFSGSEAKGALGVSEVTMVLDNSNNQGGIDYPEIEITRRLYRSGEGEYLINNNPVRLLDVHLLLAKLQFGQHSYSIVGQGTIDRMLTVTPSERKDFLDEAAGIKEFQIKQHQAELKLSRTAENMNQVKTLLAEVEPRLKSLARQVRKLEQRREIEIKLRDAQENYYASIYWTNQKEFDRLTQTLNGVENDYRGAFENLNSIQTELAELARASSRQEVFGELQNRHQAAVKVKNEWERQLSVLQGKLQTAYSEVGKQNIGWLENKIKNLKAAISSKQAEGKVREEKIAKLDALLFEKQKQVEDLQNEKTQCAVKISQLQTQSMQEQSERQFLEYSGFTAVKAVLQAGPKLGKIYGLVSELADVEEEHRLALEVAAAQHLSSVVVKDEGVAKNAIEFLRQEKMGVATFLPLNKINGREINEDAKSILNESGVLGLAIDLMKFSEQFRPIFSYIFGDTIVVKDLIAAERIGVGRARMVTLEGDVVEKRGVMRGGYRANKKRGLSFASKFSVAAAGEVINYKEEILKQQNILQDLVVQVDGIQKNLVNIQVEKQTLSAGIGLMDEEIKQAESELSELDRELSFVRMSPEEYSVHLSTLSQEREKIVAAIAESDQEIGRVAGEIENFNRREEEKKNKIFSLQEAMQKRQLQVNEILNTRNDIKIQLARLETKREDLGVEVANEIGLSLAALAERKEIILTAEELSQTAADIQKHKYQLSLIGGIDSEVTEEYATTKERFDFLSNQLDDLTSATVDLEKMIEELAEIMKKKRAASFKKIRKEFDRYFRILFNGGSAALEEIYGEPESEEQAQDLGVNENTALENKTAGLVEELGGENSQTRKREKILTGVDIVANPPGKKVKNLSALSGGERTLTSIALICAILNCNPAPFVVLDEVEAALDESNTLRFVNIMSELARQSQFIVITHNRVTMHAADALYGVTMGGDGISKLLSVKIEDAPKYEEKPVEAAIVDKTS